MSAYPGCSFELTILGSGGGPLNNHTQSFLMKRAGSTDSGYICIDAGSGLAEIAEMIYAQEYGNTFLVKSLYRSSAEDVSRFLAQGVRCTIGFGTPSEAFFTKSSEPRTRIMRTAFEIFSEIKDYFITHPHLDHMVGLVLNSPVIYSKLGSYKKVYGTEYTIQMIKAHIFNDSIWPDLTVDKAIRLEPLKPKVSKKVDSIAGIDCTPFELHHGNTARDKESVMSTAYLFHDHKTDGQILICGDTESDLISQSTAMHDIWKHLAENVPIDNLKAIVLECSNTDEVDNSELYGHMSPKHIIWELKRLIELYDVEPEKFSLHIILTHIKDSDSEEDPKITVLKQVTKRCKQSGLDKYGISFSIAIQGFTIIL
ncbi:unnamed protein product [Kluyveromyces dobzhanskii CBS 2104]|uniref:WGS project CCBQ000000000 data, contig 00102 n=1 Tax=Kluyveromyces dobzhanskii CBS 2104 TaxID=1427455 RepID=A0A0A8L6D3_9SACH|nr:unnamed protein product [Kluyveromyces dobzhanskii CBS 2104]